MDLLLNLIEKQEIDIYDIPIAQITEQYLDYLQAMPVLDLDLASEFLLMATTLLAIKVRMLLPRPPRLAEEADTEVGPDPRAELVDRLVAYKQVKELAVFLQECADKRGQLFSRSSTLENFFGRPDPDTVLQDISLPGLLELFRNVLSAAEEVEPSIILNRDDLTVQDKVKEILTKLSGQRRNCYFRELFQPRATRIEIIVTFLALLELMRLGQVGIRQNAPFDEIMVFSRIKETSD